FAFPKRNVTLWSTTGPTPVRKWRGTGWPSFWRRRDHESCTEGYAEVRQEHHRDRQDVQGIHGRGTSRDEGARPRAEGGRAPRPARGQGGRGERRAGEDRRDAGTGSRPGRAAPCNHQSQRAGPLAEDLVRDARVCQGRQGGLLLPKRAEVQGEVRDVRLQRRGEPRQGRHVADRLRAEGVNRRRRGEDRRAREEGGELRFIRSFRPLRGDPHRSPQRRRAVSEISSYVPGRREWTSRESVREGCGHATQPLD